MQLSALLPEAVETGLFVEDKEIGASAPAMAIASSLHETQYTRLFRS
jgi:urease accessory protein